MVVSEVTKRLYQWALPFLRAHSIRTMYGKVVESRTLFTRTFPKTRNCLCEVSFSSRVFLCSNLNWDKVSSFLKKTYSLPFWENNVSVAESLLTEPREIAGEIQHDIAVHRKKRAKKICLKPLTQQGESKKIVYSYLVFLDCNFSSIYMPCDTFCSLSTNAQNVTEISLLPHSLFKTFMGGDP